MKSALKLLLLSIFTLLFSIYYTSSVYALSFEQGPVLVNPSASYSTCSNSSFCTTAGNECWNSESPGETDCGQVCKINGSSFGSAWTKYQYGGCVQTDYNEFADQETCNPVYNKVSAVYSTADKCGDGGNYPQSEPYLRTGRCDGSIGGIYKVCCANDGGISPNACVPIEPFSGAPTPPMDGICPGGSYATDPGVTSCPSAPEPPSTPYCGDGVCNNGETQQSCPGDCGSPVVNECPTPGAACGSCVSQSCSGVACASGHNYCVYSSSGNYCGACQTEVNNCSTQAECVSSPTLDDFSGDDACIRPGETYPASLLWSGTPLPASDAGCANGFWVDIDSTGSNFSGGYYHKCVPGNSTPAPEDFNGFNGISGPLTFDPGATYRARVYNGQHSNTLPLTVPIRCVPGPTPTPTPTPIPITFATIGGKVTQCGAGPANPLANVNISIYDNDLSSTRPFSTDPSGNYSVSDFVRNGDGYAVRAPGVPVTINSTNYTNKSPSANYENQLAGGSTNCGTNCNFCYSVAPIPDYDLTNSGNITISLAANPLTGSNIVTRSLKTGIVPSVTLSRSPATPLPSGASIIYNNNNPCSPSCASNLTITISSTTPAGTYPITIIGTAAGIPDKSTNFDLIVNPNIPFCEITTPDFVPYNSSTNSWENTLVNWKTTSLGGSILWYKNGATCAPASSCPTGPNAGWDPINNVDFDGSISYDWDPNSSVSSPSTHTLGVSDATGKLYCVYPVTFGPPGATPPPPANGGPPPAPVGCSLTINNSPGTAALKTSQGSLTIQSTKPAAPMTISIDGPKTVSFGPYQTTEQTITVDTFGWPSGAYSLSNGCMSRTVNMGTIASCSSTYKDFNLSLYTFDDPDFDPNNWPQYSWDVKSSNVCWAGVTYGGAVQGASTGQVLAATSCWNDSDCNDNNACTQDICNGESWFNQGTCSYSNNTAYGTVCGNTANGGNMYCGGQPGYDTGDGICHSNYCKTNGDCNDGNACTDDTCQGYSNPQFGVETLGTCASYSNMPYATTCGQNSYCGGNAYTGAGDGICHANSCKTASDCNDNNACTTDTCNIISGETFGSCANSNLPPDTICQKDVNNNPTKLCSPGSEPGASTTITSTCSVDYIGCYSSSQTTGPSGNCCGLVNIQGNQCNYNSNCNRVNPFTSPHNVPPNPRLGGVVIHVDSNECGISQTVTTDNNGYALLTLPYAYGSAQDFTELEYRVWAEVPSGKIFTRGLKYNKISLVEVIPPPTQPEFDGVDSALDCSGNSCSGVSRTIDFGFKKLNNAWIQTTGGDVHSNIRINTPGGP